MPTGDSTKLYTPQMLGLAVELAQFPLRPDLFLRGEARSRSCGSTVELGFALDGATVSELGLRVTACAVGQAAAAIFARSARGMTQRQIADAQDSIAAWLSGPEQMPDWPDIGTLEPARAYPGRHAAILLPWKAAIAALNKYHVTG